jgi:hypothetical protein
MDFILRSFAENNIEVSMVGLDIEEDPHGFMFFWENQYFSVREDNGSFSLHVLGEHSFETLEENGGILDIVELLLDFKPVTRQRICRKVSRVLYHFGANRSWASGGDGNSIWLLDDHWGYEGGDFWGFEFSIEDRQFRIIYTKDTEKYDLLERIELGEEDEDVGILTHIEGADLMEVEEKIAQQCGF